MTTAEIAMNKDCFSLIAKQKLSNSLILPELSSEISRLYKSNGTMTTAQKAQQSRQETISCSFKCNNYSIKSLLTIAQRSTKTHSLTMASKIVKLEIKILAGFKANQSLSHSFQ